MSAPVPESSTDRLAEELRQVPDVRLAFLFGSRARGQHRTGSDFDIGLLLDPEAAAADRGATVRRLAARLGRAVSSHLLDIVVLNDAPALLRHRILRDGVVLYARTPEERVRFAVATIRDYQDGQVRRDAFTRARVERLSSDADDGGSGDLLDKARGAAALFGQTRRVP